MNELQTTTMSYNSLEKRLFGNEEVNSVSLRELYLDLGYTDANFTTWAKNNLVSKFEEDSDYIKLFMRKKLEDGTESRQNETHYIVTLDVAKHIAMASDKPKGFEIRKYFIEVEKQARKEKQLTPMQLMEKANMMLAEEVELEKLKKQRAMKLLAQAEIISNATKYTHNTYSVDEFCKIVSSKLEGVNLGRTTSYILFRSMGLVEKTSTKPTQRGMSLYLDYRSHDYGFSTRVHVDKADQLIKFMIRHLQKEYELNTELNFPIGEF